MGWYGGGMPTFAWVGMGLFWLTLLALLIWLAVKLLPGNSHRPQAATVGVLPPTATSVASAARPALAILDERLAAGEVDVETYRTIRATLVEGHQGN